MNAKKILIKAKKNIFGELSGNNISSKSGDGFDFYELKPYNFGEDVRRIDWKRSAKMNEPFVKYFHQEREIELIIVPILTGSLYFGLNKLKLELLIEILALLGFSALKNGDRYAIVSAKQHEILSTKLNKNQAVLFSEAEKISNANILGLKTNYEKLNDFLQKRFKRRCMMVLLGDFWDIPNFGALAKKHELLAINLRDSFEEDPKPIGNINHINPNSLQSQNMFLDTNKTHKIKQLTIAHDKNLQNSFILQGIRFCKIYTHDNAYAKLSSFLR